MPRVYHSISSVILGMRCQRAWAYCYVAKIREPEAEWNDKKAPARARAKGLGTATHNRLQSWQSGRPVNWRDLPGQVALSGAHHVPHPERVHVAHVEAQIGKVPLPPSPHKDALRVAYELHGVLWAGKRDLVVSAPGEFIRLKINAPDGWAQYDYKSTASIAEYALSAAELARDPQASLYTAATCDELGLEELPCRWLYLETKKVRRALPVDACITAHDAKDRMIEYAVKARELDQIERVEDAPMNPGACGEYGGCYYHVSNGGPCNARRTVGGLIQARIRRKDEMPLDAATKAKFDAMKGGGAASPPPATDPPETEPPAEKPTAPPAQKPRSRRPGSTVAVASGPAGSVLMLSAELVDAQQAAEAASARVAELLGKIKEACG